MFSRGLHFSVETLEFRSLLESVLHAKLPILAKRYSDAMMRVNLPYPFESVSNGEISNLDAQLRFKRLNHFILDGFIAPDIPAAGTSYIPRSQNEIINTVETYWPDVANLIAKTAFAIRAGQQYLDGNHRTATIYLYELAADFGRDINVDPFEFYNILSCRGYHILPGDAIDKLTKLLIKKSFNTRNINIASRKAIAKRVKEIPLRTTIYFSSMGMIRSPELTRHVLRELKHFDLRQYKLFRRCFDRTINNRLVAFPSSDRGYIERRRCFMHDCHQLHISFLPSD